MPIAHDINNDIRPQQVRQIIDQIQPAIVRNIEESKGEGNHNIYINMCQINNYQNEAREPMG